MPKEAEELTFSQLYERLLIEDDIILDELDETSVPAIRKGLSSYKTKINTKAKRAELPVEDRRIEFDVLHIYKNNTVKLRIYFVSEKRVTAKLINADKEMK